MALAGALWALGAAALGGAAGAAVSQGLALSLAGGVAAAWAGAVLAPLALAGAGPRPVATWGMLLFAGQAISLLPAGLGAWALLYSAPQSSPTGVLVGVSLGFVLVWIAFAREFGRAARSVAAQTR